MDVVEVLEVHAHVKFGLTLLHSHEDYIVISLRCKGGGIAWSFQSTPQRSEADRIGRSVALALDKLMPAHSGARESHELLHSE